MTAVPGAGRTAARQRRPGRRVWLLLAAGAALGLAACVGEPLDPGEWAESTGEIAEGAGILSGETGEWEVYQGH